MSAAPTFTWDDPFRTGFAGTYDPGTMYGLIFRAQAGDLAAKHHLSQAGFFDAQGNDTWGAFGGNAQQGLPAYHQAVSRWAQARGLGQYTGANPFTWNSTWMDANSPGFQQAWDTQWQGAHLGAPPDVPGAGQDSNAGNTTPLPPTQPAGGQPAATSQGQANNQWAAQPPAWTNGGGYRFGWDYSPQGGWRPKAQPQRAGSIIGAEVGWQTPMYIPVDYNAAGDTARFEFNGNPQAETAVERAIRKTADAVRGNPKLNAQHVFEYLLANFARDAAGQGKSIGMDMAKFAQVGYGEAYDPNKVYMAQGVINPWTGRPAGNATGGGTATPGGTQPPATGQSGTGNGGNSAGAPPPTLGLPPGYRGQDPGTGGGLTAAQRLALSDDPNQAYRYMMQQLGYNPSAPGLLGNFLKKRFQPLLEARMAASGVTDNSNYMDTIDQIINEFGGNLFQKGGNFFGNLRDVGTQAAQGARPYLDSLQDQNQAMQYMNQLGMLRYAGGNPLVQQSVADEMQRGREDYQDDAFNRELSGQQLDPFTAWLMNSRYKNYFGF